jgi:hypothetical protein
MSVGECVRDLDSDGKGAAELKRSPAHMLSNVPAINVLHGDIENPVLFVEVVYRADVRMVEL